MRVWSPCPACGRVPWRVDHAIADHGARIETLDDLLNWAEQNPGTVYTIHEPDGNNTYTTRDTTLAETYSRAGLRVTAQTGPREPIEDDL